MSAIKKKSETCHEQLVRMCKNIANEIHEGRGEDPAKWMEDVYDIVGS